MCRSVSGAPTSSCADAWRRYVACVSSVLRASDPASHARSPRVGRVSAANGRASGAYGVPAGSLSQGWVLQATASAWTGWHQKASITWCPEADLIDAIARAGVEVQTTVAAAAVGLRREIGHLLARAQDSGAVRSDIDTADLMAVLSGVLLALRHRANQGADPQRTLAILRDGLRPRPANGSP
jgi:Transcriptional regulator SbtR-like, C-terminal domain